MPKPTIKPDHLDHLTPARHEELWVAYATAALSALLSFHGSDGSATASGAAHIAEIADEMVAQHVARLGAFKEAQVTAREEEKAAKAKPGKGAK